MAKNSIDNTAIKDDYVKFRRLAEYHVKSLESSLHIDLLRKNWLYKCYHSIDEFGKRCASIETRKRVFALLSSLQQDEIQDMKRRMVTDVLNYDIEPKTWN